MKKNFLSALATAFLISTISAQAAAPAKVNMALAKQPLSFVSQSSVKPRLEKMMGLVNARFLQKNFSTVSTLQNDRNVIAVTGCRKHDCASNGSLVVYDIKHDAFKVWLTMNDKTRSFEEKGFAAPMNEDVQTTIENQ